MVQNPLATGWTRTAEQAVTAGADPRAHTTFRRRATSTDGLPRVLESAATRVLTPGVTLGRTRQAQRATRRGCASGKAPHRCARRGVGVRIPDARVRVPAMPAPGLHGCGAGRGRAADMSRPGAAVMGRAVALQTCVLATVENRFPLLMSVSCARSHSQNGHQGWVHHAPSSHRDVPTTEGKRKMSITYSINLPDVPRAERHALDQALHAIENARYRHAIAYLHDALDARLPGLITDVPLVNVPVLKYGDRCEAHGYDTYVLDGVTFHRATLGVCTDTSAPPRAWNRITGASYWCAHCEFATPEIDEFNAHIVAGHHPAPGST